MKKSLSVLISLLLIFSVVPTGMFTLTASAETSGDYTYSVSNGEARITDVSASISGAITIPSTLGGYPVTSMGDYAFSSCTGLTSITIPDSVTSIGASAFYNCESLTNVTIGNSVTSIGRSAFYNTGYYDNTANWENGVLYIGNHLIDAGSSVSGEYSIKTGTKTIADSAFYNCTSLTSVTIPDSVTSIGDDAFKYCRSLESMTLPFVGGSARSNTYLGYIFGASSYGDNGSYVPSLLKKIIISDKCTDIASYAFYNCTGLISVTISNSVTRIGEYAFYNCRSLTSVTIPDSVKSIGNYAFEFCESLNVTIPRSVKSIGDGAFKNCTSLTSVTIPDSVTSIGNSTFSYCEGLTSVMILDSVTSIGNGAFSGCTSLTSVTIPNSVTSIGDGAFSSCTSLTSVTIPNSVTSIGYGEFRNCTSLTSMTLPFVGQNADGTGFSNFGYIFGASDADDPYLKHTECVPASLKNVVITGSNSIAGYAFYGCTGIENVSFLGNVKIFGEKVFGGCTGLKSVRIPASCMRIGTMTFYDCVNLSDVYFMGEKSKRNITIEQGNDIFEKNATWHYDSCAMSAKHAYTTTVVPATLTQNGAVQNKCTVCGSSTSSTIYFPKTIKLSATAYTYNGKVQTPAVTVKDSAGNALRNGVDYTVTYASDRKNVGTYKVTIKMKGYYTGTKTLTFKINPPKTTVSKLSAGKKKITVTIGKKTKQVKGYQIQYSTSKKFSGAKSKTVSSYKTTKYTLKSLKAKKTYYVRVRTYKTVGGKQYYSGWSTYKRIKTK